MLSLIIVIQFRLSIFLSSKEIKILNGDAENHIRVSIKKIKIKMKKILLFVAILFTSLSLFSQSTSTDLCRVKKINGIEAYIMCEPLREYETVVDVGTGLKAESMITGGLINKSISGRVEQYINRAKKENLTFDAIIYTSGKRVVGVKFKDVATENTNGIGRASKMSGHPVFVMSEPLVAYEVLKSKGGGIKWKSAITGGLVNNSIEEDVEKIVKKLDGVKNVDGFLFDGTKEGEAINFKN